MIALSGGDVAKGLARYNAGPNGNLDNPETVAYVNKIVKTWKPSADALLDAAQPGAHAAGAEALSSLSKGPSPQAKAQAQQQAQQPQQPAQPLVDRSSQLAALPPDQLANVVQKVATPQKGQSPVNAALNLVGLPSMVAPPKANPLQAAGASLGAGFGETMLGLQSLAGRGASAVGAKGVGDWLQKDARTGTARLQQQEAANTQGRPNVRAVGNAVGGSVPFMVAPGGLAGQVAAGSLVGAGDASVNNRPLGAGAVEGAGAGAAGHAVGKLAGAVAKPLMRAGADAAGKYLPGLFAPKVAAGAAEAMTPAAKATAEAQERVTQAAAHPVADGAQGVGNSLAGKLKPGQSASVLSDQLAALEGQHVAQKLQWLNYVKKTLPADFKGPVDEEIYHSLEDPSAPLSDKARVYRDSIVLPIMRKTELMRQRLKALGVSVGEDVTDYVPRKLAEKAPVSHIDVNVAPQPKGFSTSASALKDRSTLALVDKSTGERLVGLTDPKTGDTQAWRDGKVVASKVDLDGKTATIQGRKFNVVGATTKEIEQHTPLQYRHSAIASAIEANANVGEALRNAQYLEGLKTAPEFRSMIVRPGVNAPEGYRKVDIPGTRQLADYQFHPRLAQTLDDFTQAHRGRFFQAGDSINRIITGSMFYNPLPHLQNVLTHAFVEQGLVGSVKEAGKEAVRLVTPGESTTMMRAIEAVTTQNEDYIKYLKAGAGLKYASTQSRDFANKMVETFVKHPDAPMVARAWGYVNPMAMGRAIYKVANQSLWAGSDVLMMRAYLEKELAGKGVAETIAKTEEHMPNYRIPGQLFGDAGGDVAAAGAKLGKVGATVGNAVGKGINHVGRAASFALQEPGLSQFGRYSYNRLASYGNLALDLISKDSTTADRAHALDQFAALVFLNVVGYPALDAAVQKATGNPDASVTRYGPAAIPHAVWDWATDKQEDMGQVLQQLYRPSPMIRIPVEAATQHNTFTGKPITTPTDTLWQKTGEEFNYALSQIAPVGDAQRIVNGKQTVTQFLLRQFGIKSPTPEQVEKTRKWAAREARARERAAQR
jgi:hypothetical protein